jgi:hypothetical protein
MKALSVAINEKGGVCCTFIVIDVKVVMDMVSNRKKKCVEGSKDERINDTKYDQWRIKVWHKVWCMDKGSCERMKT